jgi:hypothetical protein
MSRYASKVLLGLLLACNFVLAGGCVGGVTVNCPDPYTCVSS